MGTVLFDTFLKEMNTCVSKRTVPSDTLEYTHGGKTDGIQFPGNKNNYT